jgi:hypothetical protein
VSWGHRYALISPLARQRSDLRRARRNVRATQDRNSETLPDALSPACARDKGKLRQRSAFLRDLQSARSRQQGRGEVQSRRAAFKQLLRLSERMPDVGAAQPTDAFVAPCGTFAGPGPDSCCSVVPMCNGRPQQVIDYSSRVRLPSALIMPGSRVRFPPFPPFLQGPFSSHR